MQAISVHRRRSKLRVVVAAVALSLSTASAMRWMFTPPPAPDLGADASHAPTASSAPLPPPRLLRNGVTPEIVRTPAPTSQPTTTPSTHPTTDVWATIDIATLVRMLAHDEVCFNASDARYRLLRIGEAAIPALHAALQSTDRQQRMLSAEILRFVCDRPTPELLRATVEGLANIPLPVGANGAQDPSAHHDFARQGTRYLLAHAADARGYLEQGLFSTNPQQRLLCGFILAERDLGDAVHPLALMFLEHLADNAIAGDAVMAARGLYKLGEAGLPYVRQALGNATGQARELLRLIELDVVDEPRDRRDLYRRSAMHSVSPLYHDPVYEYDSRRSFPIFPDALP